VLKEKYIEINGYGKFKILKIINYKNNKIYILKNLTLIISNEVFILETTEKFDKKFLKIYWHLNLFLI